MEIWKNQHLYDQNDSMCVWFYLVLVLENKLKSLTPVENAIGK